jgi:hypothetical protein
MRNWRTAALVVVVLWMVLVALWAVDPMTISVTVAKNADGSDITATVQCDSPLSGNTNPTGALPTLPAGQAVGHAPCDGPVTSARAVFFLDVLVTAGVVLALVISRRHRGPSDDDAIAADRSSPVGA